MMKHLGLFSIVVLISFCFSFRSIELSGVEAYVASTPGDFAIKEILNITDADVDFIRWELMLTKGENKSHSFSMNLNYGVSQPNTLGFVMKGKFKSAVGAVEISKTRKGAIVYRLTSDNFKSKLSLIKLSSNVLHILDNNENLMVGNGGWSYSLNKKSYSKEAGVGLLSSISTIVLDKGTTVTFAGRTPCEPVNSEYHLELSENCLKVKWLLKLYIDPATHKPTSFYWNRTGHRTGRIDGTWSIETIRKNNLDLIICRLNPVQPFESLDMLIVDENVMYFLDKNQRIMTGDENFSFAMNRIEHD